MNAFSEPMRKQVGVGHSSQANKGKLKRKFHAEGSLNAQEKRRYMARRTKLNIRRFGIY